MCDAPPLFSEGPPLRGCPQSVNWPRWERPRRWASPLPAKGGYRTVPSPGGARPRGPDPGGPPFLLTCLAFSPGSTCSSKALLSGHLTSFYRGWWHKLRAELVPVGAVPPSLCGDGVVALATPYLRCSIDVQLAVVATCLGRLSRRSTELLGLLACVELSSRPRGRPCPCAGRVPLVCGDHLRCSGRAAPGMSACQPGGFGSL